MSNTDDVIKEYVQNLVALEGDIAAIRDDQKAIYAEAKNEGYDVKVLRKMVARANKDREAVLEEDEMLYRYENAAGMKLPNW